MTKKISVLLRLSKFLGGIVLALVVVIAAAPSPAGAATLNRQLDTGMRGSDVTSLQAFLAMDPALYPQGLMTGYYGPLTRAAVLKFQARNGISPVGRVGPLTLAAVNNQMAVGMVAGSSQSAPIISAMSTSTASSSMMFSWNTNEGASAVVYYSTSPIALTEANGQAGVRVSGTSTMVHSDLRMAHTATLTGLQTSTPYYYVVYVRDGSGNESIMWPTTFRTR